MKNKKLISIQQFCSLYETPTSFLDDLHKYEIIKFKVIDNTKHIKLKDISTVEKLIRLHYDLNINMEGLDAIIHLTNKINDLQKEINNLKRQIDFYEE
jgi:pyridoxine 5'-phosphate synthase PdxJ